MIIILVQMGCRKPNETSPLELVYPVSTNGELFPWAQYRLPRSIRPLTYNLTLNPDLVTMTFTGHTAINMLVLHETKVIVLHSSNLNISKASFKVGLQLKYRLRIRIVIFPQYWLLNFCTQTKSLALMILSIFILFFFSWVRKRTVKLKS